VERDAAPARCGSHPHVREAGVTVRAYYEALPRDGWTRTGRRRRNPLDEAGVWPVTCPGSTVPAPKIAANGASKGVSVASVHFVNRLRHKYQGALFGAPFPLTI